MHFFHLFSSFYKFLSWKKFETAFKKGLQIYHILRNSYLHGYWDLHLLNLKICSHLHCYSDSTLIRRLRVVDLCRFVFAIYVILIEKCQTNFIPFMNMTLIDKYFYDLVLICSLLCWELIYSVLIIWYLRPTPVQSLIRILFLSSKIVWIVWYYFLLILNDRIS